MSTNRRYQPRSQRTSAAAVAVLAATCVLGSVFALFGSAGSRPWLPADEAELVAHCDSMHAAAPREHCIDAAIAGRTVSHVAMR